jgi:hypothetical protein
VSFQGASCYEGTSLHPMISRSGSRDATKSLSSVITYLLLRVMILHVGDFHFLVQSQKINLRFGADFISSASHIGA